MKNILNEKPSEIPIHRLAYSVSFIQSQDLKDKRVLDIGCGFGWFELSALKLGVKEIIGIEPSEKDLQTAKNTIVKNNVIFMQGSATDLSFEDKSFDTVISWEVIEHIPKKSENKMFAGIRRILKEEGVFYLSSPNNHVVANILDPAWWLMGHRHYSYKSLLSYAKENNFKVESCCIMGGWWQIVGILDFYISKWIFRRRLFFEDFLNNRIESEFNNNRGFVNIFIKFRAV